MNKPGFWAEKLNSVTTNEMDKFKTKQPIFCQESHVLILGSIVKVTISDLLESNSTAIILFSFKLFCNAI